MTTLWPQNLSDQPEIEARPSKRPRISDDAPLNPSRNTPQVSTMPPPPNPETNPPLGGASCMFFKTRLCQKFRTGSCPWGNNCNFAHGIEELRRPPPNWQELVAEERVNGNDQQMMHKNKKVCRRYHKGEVCPYGNRCIYHHVKPENSGMAMGPMGGPDGIGLFSSAADCNGSKQKPKAKICYKWVTTGDCSYGERCIFAHGRAELKKSEGHMELDYRKIGADPSNPLTNPANNVPPIQTESSCARQAQQKKSVFPKLAKKLSCIYADWIDGTPFSSPRLSKRS